MTVRNNLIILNNHSWLFSVQRSLCIMYRENILTFFKVRNKERF
jgi:hypothetical protein